jgi:hypothetical protein
MRDCTPEPCAQVRILLEALKSNTQANNVFLASYGLTWANVRHDPMRFSQRLSCDHPVLEVDEDERGFGDIADLAGADGDVLEGFPTLG